ncbi:uncharacterized protein LOC133910652 [Phragmites australis]|uniref:uncharacterized protein LOC133910652 n=1 Tax=Phragmites australis TaxID=29695 RepID=UPI002D77D413|nr:uncharacterized protein LOC133910652 [Phragmites australis]
MADDAARLTLERRVAAFTPEDRQEAARQEAARLEAARLEAERQEAERLEAERRDADAHALVLAGEVAAATAALHAQAAAILNIKSLVPVILDLTSPHFNRWRGLFLNTLERYALADHVLSNDDRSDDVTWKRMDRVVLSWLYGTITAELLEVVMNREEGPPTARIVWLGLEQQFIDNKETRALLLDAEFRTFVQGDLSIDDYCHQLKAMADQLADLGEPVRDRTLVLNVLRGLNDRFAHLAALIQCQRPLPMFIEVRSDLRLAEITMKAKQGSPAQALAASTPRAPPPTFYNPVAGSNFGKKPTRRGGGSGKKSGAAGAGPAFPGAPWATQAQWPTPPPPGWQPAYDTFQAY